MIKNIMIEIGGIGLMGIVSLVLFFAVFTGMLIHVIRLKKPYLQSMGDLPLNDGVPASPAGGDPRHD